MGPVEGGHAQRRLVVGRSECVRIARLDAPGARPRGTYEDDRRHDVRGEGKGEEPSRGDQATQPEPEEASRSEAVPPNPSEDDDVDEARAGGDRHEPNLVGGRWR